MGFDRQKQKYQSDKLKMTNIDIKNDGAFIISSRRNCTLSVGKNCICFLLKIKLLFQNTIFKIL